jgi:hypothetical protein
MDEWCTASWMPARSKDWINSTQPPHVQGESAIVQIGWGALAASFTLSLTMTVWGRAGL